MEKNQISFIKKLMLRKDRQYIIFFDRKTGWTDELIIDFQKALKELGYDRVLAARVDDVEGIKVIEKLNGN